ncbi:hypothetical protein GOODEAATRI_011753 [Goodea atripinnis]|uniref:Uncharacterized protein n=1 Tax=Goodea atripinnis TaxID=208336 RepID=A0ABV0PX92_9TELE
MRSARSENQVRSIWTHYFHHRCSESLQSDVVLELSPTFSDCCFCEAVDVAGGLEVTAAEEELSGCCSFLMGWKTYESRSWSTVHHSRQSRQRSPVDTISHGRQRGSAADGSPSPPVLQREPVSSPLLMHPDEFEILDVWSPPQGPGREMRSTRSPPATRDFRKLRRSGMKSTDGRISSTLISTVRSRLLHVLNATCDKFQLRKLRL